MSDEQRQRPAASGNKGKRGKSGMSLSMHDGIGIWCDCCSCEAEERWAALADEMGIDLSDYEDDPEEQAPGDDG